MHELYLASQSPRRKTILMERGFKFRTFPIEVSEIPDKNLNQIEQISKIAQDKAVAAANMLKHLNLKNILILTADTMVCLDSDILGKPKNHQEAMDTLTRLSGRSHQVITGFCLLELKTQCLILGHGLSEVVFRKLSNAEIKKYVLTNDPMDKAGSYGIQGDARNFVSSFSGSFENIVGLPIDEIEKVIKEKGWEIEKESK
jgi:septum formation protein